MFNSKSNIYPMDHPFFCIALNPAFQEYVTMV